MLLSTPGARRRPAAAAKRLGLIAALLLGAQVCYAQVAQLVGLAILMSANGGSMGPDMQFVSKGKGSYQLPDASWQTSYVTVTNKGLEAGKGKQAIPMEFNEFRQAVVNLDTFAVVTDVRFMPVDKDAQPVRPVTLLGRRVLHRPQVELLEYATVTGAVPVLRFPDGRAVALPKKPKDFRAAMLLLVGDQPKLAEQLRGNELEATHARQILDVYLRWKPAGFDPTALLAAAPAAQ
ncbi:hypothetical protein EJV47_09210 [Hymenobacter gummosus]|uniref:Uncharacterized protein n=1 Tax=Hymenobacter gummosus TaxID=1776032 RepID=A0A431U4K4_9BACT|nr:hypothetical protein [Hymenobacter gummosus]RTQ50789.1 hypothetical protein EJV47_09210 [Hymenobacter gummosus]